MRRSRVLRPSRSAPLLVAALLGLHAGGCGDDDAVGSSSAATAGEATSDEPTTAASTTSATTDATASTTASGSSSEGSTSEGSTSSTTTDASSSSTASGTTSSTTSNSGGSTDATASASATAATETTDTGTTGTGTTDASTTGTGTSTSTTGTGSTTSTCPAGAEGCPCLMDGSCNPGRTCVEGICTAAPPVCELPGLDCQGMDGVCDADAGAAATCGACDNDCTAGGNPNAGCGLDLQCVTLVAIEDVVDTYVDASMPDLNLENATQFLVDTMSVEYRSYIVPGPTAIDAIPVGVTIDRAYLRITPFDPGSDVTASLLTDVLDATTVTFANQPTMYGAAVATFTPVAEQRVNIDLTAAVQDWYAGVTPFHGVVLTTEGTNGSDFYSTEGSVGAERPVLVVEYTP